MFIRILIETTNKILVDLTEFWIVYFPPEVKF